jgi:hypothetical protein
MSIHLTMICIQMITLGLISSNNLNPLIRRLFSELMMIMVNPLEVRIYSDFGQNSYPKVFTDKHRVYVSLNIDVNNRFSPLFLQEQERLTVIILGDIP